MNQQDDFRNAAVLTSEEGDEIAAIYVSPKIETIGTYKLIVLKRKSGKYEWANFVERDNGMRNSVYRGEFDKPEQIEILVSSINKALNTAYGPDAKLCLAKAVMKTMDGKEIDLNSLNS
ncbi:MAG TPA: hypothetical protein VE978_22060 [Chitinophagales bacterium]|nr:hypothetical protein [Chitinophagales bacterium]